jgi:hypothetical protein
MNDAVGMKRAPTPLLVCLLPPDLLLVQRQWPTCVQARHWSNTNSVPVCLGDQINLIQTRLGSYKMISLVCG